MLPVTLEWIGAKQFEATNIEDVKFRMDVKKKGGGAGLYASPTDHLLGGRWCLQWDRRCGHSRQDAARTEVTAH